MLKAQIIPSATKVRYPHPAHHVNRHNSTKNDSQICWCTCSAGVTQISRTFNSAQPIKLTIMSLKKCQSLSILNNWHKFWKISLNYYLRIMSMIALMSAIMTSPSSLTSARSMVAGSALPPNMILTITLISAMLTSPSPFTSPRTPPMGFT